MSVSELVQYFYYNVPLHEYNTKADEYQEFLIENQSNKEEFLDQLSKYVPDKGFSHVKDYLKKEYSFNKQIARVLETPYKESAYSNSFSFINCISAIFYELARSISFYEKRPAYNADDYRKILDYLKTVEFQDVFTNVYITQKPTKGHFRQLSNDRYHFEAMVFAHFAYKWFFGEKEFDSEYVEFLEKYVYFDERNENLPYINEVEKQIVQKIQGISDKTTAKQTRLTNNSSTSKPTSQSVLSGLKNEYIKAGKTESDFNRFVSICRELYRNDPLLYVVQAREGIDEDHYIYEVLNSEIAYQKVKNVDEDLLDRFIKKPTLQIESSVIKQHLSERDFIEYFTYDDYAVSFLKELSLALFRCLNLDTEDVVDFIKTDEDCKRSYNYLKERSNDLVLRIYHSAFEEYVSNLLGALLLNTRKKTISRLLYGWIDNTGISYPDCFSESPGGKSAINGYVGAAESESGYQYAACNFLITYLKCPAACFSFATVSEFMSSFINRYCISISDPGEIKDSEINNTLNPIFDDMRKKENDGTTVIKKGHRPVDEAYAIYSAATKAYGLNGRFLSPENMFSAFKDERNHEFLANFTFYYFNKYIGTENALRSFNYNDYYQAYTKALIYKELIDHIFEDENLIPPDFDLSFEDNFKDLLEQKKTEIDEIDNEDSIDSLINEIKRIKQNRDQWEQEAHVLHDNSNELKKDLDKAKKENSELENELDVLQKENNRLNEISLKYNEMIAKQIAVRPDEIYSLLSSRKIAISGKNKTLKQRFTEKYPNITWYEEVSEVNRGAAQMDYIFVMTQFNEHKLSEIIEKQTKGSKTKIFLTGEVRSNFELAEKVIYNKIRETESENG